MADSEFSFEVARVAYPRTVRLVSSARLREAVLTPLADTPDELALLAEIEGATSGRLIAQERGLGTLTADELVHGVPHARFINASFAYAKPRQPMRFSPANRGAWYAALAVETCIAEVGYHLTRALDDAGDYDAIVEYGEMLASMSGLFVDLRSVPDHPSLAADTAIGYPAGNAIAAMARAEGHNGIIYPSVRQKGGTCIAALWPNVVQSVVQGSMYRLTWSGSPDYAWDAI
ncbi:RES family NAD+ phosphorylase [Taklimakanibacter lacteus]|uniref:RES family NAD+ phosphorylase n=1 Tax=Taklimakanibacter lacteus TaxID=2268456 RepID=UPI000E66095A